MPSPAESFPYQATCLSLLDADDGYGLHQTAMAWRVAGGDMALGTWIDRPLDRLTVRYLRGLLILDHVRDPLRSLGDLQAATQAAPWLAALAASDLARAEPAASRSKIKVARVGPSPDFSARHQAPDIAPPAEPVADDGAKPALWDVALPRIRTGGHATQP